MACGAGLASALLGRGPTATGGAMTIRRFLTLAMIAVGAGISANEFAPAQNPPQPDPTATMALPSAGPADPKLRAISLPDGKTMHLLPATLETTQWGWF